MLSSSWNMPPGCYTSMIPGWEDEPVGAWLHCQFCGCYVSTKAENVIRVEEHSAKDNCPGTHCAWGPHDQCDKGFYRPKTEAEKASGLLNRSSGQTWEMPEHGSHEIDVYAGITTWFRCHRCNCSVPMDEY